MGTPVDFDLAVLILRVLEGWELGNDGLYKKYWPYIKKIEKIQKFQNLILVPGIQKTDVYDFSGFFYEEWAGNLGITSETTWEKIAKTKNKHVC